MKLKLEGRKKPLLIAWIHSHVRGSECGFSSIDNHTQHSFSKLYKGVLGLVIEIKKNDQRGPHDFFELTHIGRKTIEWCSRQKNCISTEQHDSCNERHFYQSAHGKVIFDPSYSLKVRNFMVMNEAGAASQLEWDKGDFEEDIADHSEDEQNEFKAPPSKKQKKQAEACKICHNKFPNLFVHLSRWSKDCRSQYGKEFEEIKKRKEDEQKAKGKKRDSDRYEINKEDVNKRNQQYKNENAETIRETRKRYNMRFADKNKVITFSVELHNVLFFNIHLY